MEQLNNLRNLVYNAEMAMKARDVSAVERLLDQIAQRQEVLAKLEQATAKRKAKLDRRIRRLWLWCEPH